MAFKLVIPAFPEGGSIPSKYTCDARNVSPVVQWTDAPRATRSFVLIFDDPDAPSGLFTHWILYNIPPSVDSLAEAYAPTGGVAAGTNDFGKSGYGGPCPPKGTHRYYFRLFALDVASLDVRPGAKRSEVDRVLHRHVLEGAEYMGRYQRA